MPDADPRLAGAADFLRLLTQPARLTICLMPAEEGELEVGVIRDRLVLARTPFHYHISAQKMAGVVGRRRRLEPRPLLPRGRPAGGRSRGSPRSRPHRGARAGS